MSRLLASFASMRAQLVVLVAISVIPVFGLMLWSASDQRNHASAQATEAALHSARSVAEAQRLMLEDTQRVLEDVGREAQLRDAAGCGHLLADVSAYFEQFLNLVYVAPNGDVVCGAQPMARPVNVADRSVFKQAVASGRFTTGDYVIGALTGQPTVNMAMPVVDEGSLLGVISGALNLDWLHQSLTVGDLPPGSTITVFDSAGHVLAGAPGGSPVGDESATASLFTATLQGGHEGTAVMKGPDGAEHLYAFSVLGSDEDAGHLYVSVGMPTSAIFAAADAELEQNLIRLAVVGLLAVLTTLAGGEILLRRRILGLVGLTRRLRGGDFGARSGMSSRSGEVGELGYAFDELAKSLEEREARLTSYEAFLKAVPATTVVVGSDGLIKFFNQAAVATFGYAEHEIIGKPITILAPSFELDWSGDKRASGGSASGDFATTGRRKGGSEFPMEGFVSQTLRNSGSSLMLVLRDVTTQRATQARLAQQAFHDQLTGLANRAYFMDRLDAVLRGGAQRVAILLLDLDRFKVINDSLGHPVGDQFLIGAGRQFASCVRAGDVLARLGGDEFAILLDDVRGPREVQALAQRLIEQLRQPLTIDGNELFATTSVGVAIGQPGDNDAGELMRRADIALYRAKQQGKNRFAFYSTSRDARPGGLLQLEADLRGALDRNEFTLRYQPFIDLKSGAVVGVEALIRWQHPSLGLLKPAKFLTLAGELGLNTALGRWILEEAGRLVTDWQERFPRHSELELSMNVSPGGFRGTGFAERLTESTQVSGINAQHLQIEILEHAFLEDAVTTMRTIEAIRKTGTKIAIDDFGTGYSSLGYLQRLKVDAIKIDRSFVKGIENEGSAFPIVESIVSLAHALGIEVTAEGVETAEQLALVIAAGCDRAHGSGHRASAGPPGWLRFSHASRGTAGSMTCESQTGRWLTAHLLLRAATVARASATGGTKHP